MPALTVDTSASILARVYALCLLSVVSAVAMLVTGFDGLAALMSGEDSRQHFLAMMLFVLLALVFGGLAMITVHMHRIRTRVR